MKKRAIRTQLFASFLTLAVIIIGSISLITFRLIESHFKKYIDEQQDYRLEQYVNTLDLLWSNSEQSWTDKQLSLLSEKALKDNFYFSISDNNGDTIWELQGKDLSKAQSILKKSKTYLKSSNENSFKKKDKQLIYDGKKIGKVSFYYFGPFSYTAHDAQFISSFQKSLIFLFLSALLVSFLFASWISRKLSEPLKHISTFTHELSTGNYSNHIPQETSITEINFLIDSLNDLNDQLEKQYSLRKRLTTDISHELRTPLTTLMGNLEGMIDGIWDLTPERLQLCYSEVERLTRLIGNIELLNRIEANSENLHKTTFDLGKLTKQVILNFSSKIEEKSLNVSIDDRKVKVYADKDKINQVITNLLSNAIRFTPNGGTISFKLCTINSFPTLIITDDGIGIKKDQINNIFDRFYTSDPSRNANFGGQGIGLAIVKSIVNAHRASISVQSNYGQGTSFTITFLYTK